LTLPFRCERGVRLKRRYGLCRFEAEGQALIQVRCTATTTAASGVAAVPSRAPSSTS
jgi:hypothetical protein